MSGRIRSEEEPQQQPLPPPAPLEQPRAAPQEPTQAPERPAAPPQPPAAETPPAPSQEAAEGQQAEGEGEPPPSPEVKKRIDRLTWEKYEARRQADELAQRLAEIERRQTQRPDGQADPVETAKNELRQEAQQQEFNRACNDVYRRGQQEFGAEMDDAVRALNAVGYGSRPDALAAIAQLPDGHRVYRALASDLDNASRVLGLPPMAMAVELARMAIGAAPGAGGGVAAVAQAAPGVAQAAPGTPPPAVTRAPEPIRPIGGTSRSGPVPLDKTSIADFIRRRDADERARSRIAR